MDSIGQYWTLARRAILVGYKGRGLYLESHNPNSPWARTTPLAKEQKMTIEERLERLEKRNRRLTTALTVTVAATAGDSCPAGLRWQRSCKVRWRSPQTVRSEDTTAAGRT